VALGDSFLAGPQGDIEIAITALEQSAEEG
jgi:hypothetical protein